MKREEELTVSVKPLVWVSYQDSPNTAPRWKAVHGFGEYRVVHNLRDGEFWSPELGGVGVYWNSEQEAKAAAQADFNSRIRSALLPNPKPEAEICPGLGLPHQYWPQGNCQYCGASKPKATEGVDRQVHHSKPVVSQNTQILEDKATEGEAHEKGIEVAVDAFQEMTGGFDDDAHIIRKVIRAYLDEVERSTPRYRHKKRGTVYDVITSTARLQTSGKLEDNEVMWVYRGSDGQVWVRSDMEFMDGRFELVAALTAKQTDGREE